MSDAGIFVLCYEIIWGEQPDQALKCIRVRHAVAMPMVKNTSGTSSEPDSNVSLRQIQLQAPRGPTCTKDVLQPFPVTSAPGREEPEWGSWQAPCKAQLEESELKNGNVQRPRELLRGKGGADDRDYTQTSFCISLLFLHSPEEQHRTNTGYQ